MKINSEIMLALIEQEANRTLEGENPMEHGEEVYLRQLVTGLVTECPNPLAALVDLIHSAYIAGMRAGGMGTSVLATKSTTGNC